MLRVAVATIAFSVVLVGCSQSNLNNPCVLRKNSATDLAGIPMTEGDVTSADGVDVDYISRTVECDQSFCVRDFYFKSDASTPDASAIGYCSAPCDIGETNSCANSDPDPNHKLECRALILTPETLKVINESDAGTTLSGIRRSNFCVRGPPK